MLKNLITSLINKPKKEINSSDSDLNEQQKVAVEMRNYNILVLAGAGTGKTWTIVSRVADLIKNGESRDIINKQPSLNSILTKCVGHQSCVPDSKIIEITKPCIVLAGSDGVFGFLPEEKLKQIIKAKFTVNSDLQEIADEIVKLSMEYGSDDNVTAVLSAINPSQKYQKKSKRLTKLQEWNL